MMKMSGGGLIMPSESDVVMTHYEAEDDNGCLYGYRNTNHEITVKKENLQKLHVFFSFGISKD